MSKRRARKGPPWCHKPAGSRHWHYDFRLKGLRYRGSTDTDCARTAEAVVTGLRNAILSGEAGKPRAITVDEALGRYLLEHAQFQPSYEDAARDAADIAAAFGASTPLDAITDDMLAKVVAIWRGQKDRRYGKRKDAPLVSPRTVNARLVRLRAVINMAGEKWNAAVPKIKWSRHKLKEPPGRQRYLSREEAERVLAEAAPHLRPGIELALWTGIRLDNCISLDWRQVDMQRREIRVMQKGGDWHSVPLVGPAFLALANLHPKASGPVFLYTPPAIKGAKHPPEPRPIKSWRKAWRRACERAGVEDARWHDLRHTCASWLAGAGVDIRTIKEILGHASITTTMRYAHLYQDAQRAALERVWTRNSHSAEGGQSATPQDARVSGG